MKRRTIFSYRFWLSRFFFLRSMSISRKLMWPITPLRTTQTSHWHPLGFFLYSFRAHSLIVQVSCRFALCVLAAVTHDLSSLQASSLRLSRGCFGHNNQTPTKGERRSIIGSNSGDIAFVLVWGNYGSYPDRVWSWRESARFVWCCLNLRVMAFSLHSLTSATHAHMHSHTDTH